MTERVLNDERLAWIEAKINEVGKTGVFSTVGKLSIDIQMCAQELLIEVKRLRGPAAEDFSRGSDDCRLGNPRDLKASPFYQEGWICYYYMGEKIRQKILEELAQTEIERMTKFSGEEDK